MTISGLNLFVVAGLLLASGCAGNQMGWTHPDKGPDEFKADKEECLARHPGPAEAPSYDKDRPLSLDNTGDFKRCMERLGWKQ